MRTLVHRTEFCEHPRSATHPDPIEGRAIPLSEADSVEGAWVILEAVPVGSAFTKLAAQLARQGAVGILTPLSATAEGYLVKRIMAGTPVALPVLSVRTDLLPQLAGSIIGAMVPVFPHLPFGYNVLASLTGTDPQYVDAPLLVGAHYDGVGDDVGGRRLEGATDNAAAVAVLLELAHVLARFPSLPRRRPLLLVAFDAEETGAQGSRTLAHMLKEQGKTPLVLNLDGAACRNEAVWVEPGAHTQTILEALDQAGRWLDIPLILGNIASDHRPFSQRGVPAVGLSVRATGLHTPADAMEQVQPEALLVAATLLLATIWQLAWNG
jgi:aminopeptidase YwaD